MKRRKERNGFFGKKIFLREREEKRLRFFLEKALKKGKIIIIMYFFSPLLFSLKPGRFMLA